MRYSNNLNIILKACEKAGNYILRDFAELGNLQSNSKIAQKFTNSCYQKVKKIITDDLLKFKPKYNFYFSDGQKIVNDEKSQYHFVIFPISGVANLERANPDFVVAIALNYGDNFEESKSIAVVIKKILPNETFYCEKGFGAFLNNRRIKITKRSSNDVAIVDNISQYKEFNPNDKAVAVRSYGSKILELAYLACNRIDFVSLKSLSNYQFTIPFTLIAEESGAKKVNDLIYFNNSIIPIPI
jgi:myo-inositol-1(or 4)-monophosphatase